MNTIVSKGRRVWEEGGERLPGNGPASLYGRFYGGALKVWQFGDPKSFKSIAGIDFRDISVFTEFHETL